MVASEAHAVTLAIEGLLGVVFTVATLTDEAVDVGEVTLHIFTYEFVFLFLCNICLDYCFQLESPRCDTDPPAKFIGKTAVLCTTMVDSVWLTILDALSLILTKYCVY